MSKNGLGIRLKKIFENLKGTDALYLRNTQSQDPNFAYLTGFASGLFEDTTLIATKQKIYVITSPLEYDTALEQKKSGMRIINSGYGAKTGIKWITKLVKHKKVAANLFFLPEFYAKRLKNVYKVKRIVDASEGLLGARLVKEEDEVRKIGKAVSITKRALKEIQKYFHEGVTELELAARFDFIQMSLGATCPSFQSIVCFGKNAAQPHHSPDKTKLKRGDLVLIDVGAKVENYCSDLTRTFIFGKPRDKQVIEMLEIVKQAQGKAIGAIKPNIDGSKIHNLAENYINSAKNGKYKGRFIHALGHSLGLEVHDGIGFSKQKNILKPGMVITVEPGIYVPGYGGVRFEDDILVTKDGCTVL